MRRVPVVCFAGAFGAEVAERSEEDIGTAWLHVRAPLLHYTEGAVDSESLGYGSQRSRDTAAAASAGRLHTAVAAGVPCFASSDTGECRYLVGVQAILAAAVAAAGTVVTEIALGRVFRVLGSCENL